MCQTLFYIPATLGGWPFIGFGMLLGAWLVGCAAFIAWRVRLNGWDAETRGMLPMIGIVAVVIAFVLPMMAEPAVGGWQQSIGIPIRGFGVMLLLGIVSGHALATYQARRNGVDPEMIFSLAFWLIVAGILGARAFYVIQYWRDFARPNDPIGTLQAIVSVANGGIVIYGAVIGAAVGLFLFCRRYPFPVLAMADMLAPALVVGYAFGRIGCLMNGCCYGGPAEVPWSVTFPPNSPPYVRQIDDGMIPLYAGIVLPSTPDAPAMIERVEPDSPAQQAGLKAGNAITKINGIPIGDAIGAKMVLRSLSGSTAVVEINSQRTARVELPAAPPRSLPVHPTQIYSSINAFLLAFFLFAYYPFRRRDGEVIGLLLSIYPVSRFLIESIRIDEPGVFGTSFSIAQVISLGLLAAMAIYWPLLWRYQKLGSALPFERSRAATTGGTHWNAGNVAPEPASTKA